MKHRLKPLSSAGVLVASDGDAQVQGIDNQVMRELDITDKSVIK